jgi:sensor domain CHASE-containing protein
MTITEVALVYLRLVRNLTREKLEKPEIQSDPKVKEIARQIDMNGKLKEKKRISSSASAAAPQVLKYKQLKVNPSGVLSKSIK